MDLVKALLVLSWLLLSTEPQDADEAVVNIPFSNQPIELQYGVCAVDRSVDCSIISLPIPEYPPLATAVETDCEARVRLEATGKVTVVYLTCEDERFIDTTRTAFDAMRWMPTNACGQLCPRAGTIIEYPITYRLE